MITLVNSLIIGALAIYCLNGLFSLIVGLYASFFVSKKFNKASERFEDALKKAKENA
jgi:hypothetical protein